VGVSAESGSGVLAAVDVSAGVGSRGVTGPAIRSVLGPGAGVDGAVQAARTSASTREIIAFLISLPSIFVTAPTNCREPGDWKFACP
jgi:hypothetical protein